MARTVANTATSAHAGAVVDDAPAATSEAEQARQRIRDAEEQLERARGDAAAQLPGGGYMIATERLFVAGGARAHNAGDRVPVGNVERNGWQGQVREPVDGE